MKEKIRFLITNLLSTILLVFAIQFFVQSQTNAPEQYKVCAACHTIGEGKLIGPDLKGITEKRDEAWLIDFIRSSQTMIKNGDEEAVKLFDEYKIPMPDNKMTDEEIKEILTFIRNSSKEPVLADKTESQSVVPASSTSETVLEDFMPYQLAKSRLRLNIKFLISILLILLMLIDLIFTRFIKFRIIHIVIILVALTLGVQVVVAKAIGLGRQEGYEPDQPIKFSHKVHVTGNKIDCKYCHSTVEESRYAGIPSTSVCLNCHHVVREGQHTGTTEINKIYEAFESQKPIEWVKVHNLPDHVFFSHAQHVAVGKVDCNHCHGEVENMDRIRQVNSLSMGWCINCHRNTEVQFKSNEYYTSFMKLHDDIKSGKISKVTVDQVGGNNCQACHN